MALDLEFERGEYLVPTWFWVEIGCYGIYAYHISGTDVAYVAASGAWSELGEATLTEVAPPRVLRARYAESGTSDRVWYAGDDHATRLLCEARC
eukprot:807216-Rhodomonas_salina.1